MYKINQLARLAVSTAALALSLAAEPVHPILEAGQNFTIHGHSYKAGAAGYGKSPRPG